MKRPLVVAFCGLPGAGKSFLAESLARHGGWRHLDRDRIRAARCGGEARTDPEAKQAAENEMARRMARAVAAGESVLLDGMTLARRADRRAWADACARAGGGWRLVYLDCPPELAAARVGQDREHPAADRDPALVHRVAAVFESPDPEEISLSLDARRLTDAVELHARLLAEA